MRRAIAGLSVGRGFGSEETAVEDALFGGCGVEPGGALGCGHGALAIGGAVDGQSVEAEDRENAEAVRQSTGDAAMPCSLIPEHHVLFAAEKRDGLDAGFIPVPRVPAPRLRAAKAGSAVPVRPSCGRC